MFIWLDQNFNILFLWLRIELRLGFRLQHYMFVVWLRVEICFRLWTDAVAIANSNANANANAANVNASVNPSGFVARSGSGFGSLRPSSVFNFWHT